MISHKSDENSIILCSNALKENKLVILPTDTVYGFSTIANENLENDKKIRAAKGREEKKPFIQLIAKAEDITKYSNEKIPGILLEKWPGPLTIIVKDKRDEQKSTAFRCPGDEWLRKVIELCEFPIYSTSANLSGQPILETENQILDVFGNVADLIVLDGDRKNCLPSTLVKLENGTFTVLRQGEIKL